MTVATALDLIVHFVAAGEPFKDQQADPTETLGHLKERVLTFFDLAEGSASDGSVTTYTLYHEKEALTDLSRTIGDVAGGKKELQLKLNQQIVQGR